MAHIGEEDGFGAVGRDQLAMAASQLLIDELALVILRREMDFLRLAAKILAPQQDRHGDRQHDGAGPQPDDHLRVHMRRREHFRPPQPNHDQQRITFDPAPVIEPQHAVDDADRFIGAFIRRRRTGKGSRACDRGADLDGIGLAERGEAGADDAVEPG